MISRALMWVVVTLFLSGMLLIGLLMKLIDFIEEDCRFKRPRQKKRAPIEPIDERSPEG